MSFANGQFPASALGDVPGPNAGLIKPAALAYSALHVHVLKQMGVSMALADGSIGRCYRNFARQVIARQFWCNLGKCGNAALPGTSNHGLGTTVDLAAFSQRTAIDRHGVAFGFSKSWSDAAHEWWHIKYQAGHFRPRPDPLKPLPKHMERACRLLLFRRRRRAAERPTGKGFRWRRWNRAVKRSHRRVEFMHRRADNPQFKKILGLVLADRNGFV